MSAAPVWMWAVPPYLSPCQVAPASQWSRWGSCSPPAALPPSHLAASDTSDQSRISYIDWCVSSPLRTPHLRWGDIWFRRCHRIVRHCHHLERAPIPNRTRVPTLPHWALRFDYLRRDLQRLSGRSNFSYATQAQAGDVDDEGQVIHMIDKAR